MSILSDLHLTQDELVKCEAKNGLLLVPALIAGEEAQLLLDTGAQGGIVLDWRYAEQRGLAITDVHAKPSAFFTDPSRKAGTTRLRRVSVVGRTVNEITVSVCELLSSTDPLSGQVAGYLGPGFLNDGLLVVAAAERTVGFSQTLDKRRAFESAAMAVKLLTVGGEFLPFTGDVSDALMPDQAPLITLLDTGSRVSIISVNYVRRKKGHRILRWFLERAFRRGRRVPWTFELPGGAGFRTRVQLVEFSPAYVEGTGMERVDAILGMDFFYHWVALFNFPSAQVALFPPGK